MENRLSAVEIINETVEFYSQDVTRRSLDNGICLYAGPEGKKCAYARCWREGVYKPEYEGITAINPKLPRPDELVEERYKGQFVSFWRDLQFFHDSVDNWDGNVLTVHGKKYVETLLKKYS